MVLNHLGIQIGYDRLVTLLRAGELFTLFSNLRYLEKLGLYITLGDQGEVSMFETNLQIGLPVVVGVTTLGWQHWNQVITEHAVVVVGIDRQNDVIYVNDPAFSDAPIEMSLIEFESGWEEKGRKYAIIGLAPP